MRDYILFIDTEASGWPKNWDAPYSLKNNWPYSIQIAWIVYDKLGNEIKHEDHYINEDIRIEDSSFRIHGISEEFLKENGKPRKYVMTLLANDLLQYQPLLAGHFMEFDMHMIGADFYRAGIKNVAEGLPVFCTMKSTSEYAGIEDRKYLRLNELYNILFDKVQPEQHNALSDASAAAVCFFELVKRGEITDKKIDAQQADDAAKKKLSLPVIGILAAAVIIIVALIIHFS